MSQSHPMSDTTHIHQKNKRWEESIALSKQDKLYKDAIITASTSGATEVAEELLSYFVDIGNRECFAAMLYACFDLLRSDVIEELSWQHGLNDFFMPYRIQVQRSMIEKVTCVVNGISRKYAHYRFTDSAVGERGQGTLAERQAKGGS